MMAVSAYGRYSPDISRMCNSAKRSEMRQKHCAIFLGTDIIGYNKHDNIGNIKGTIHAEATAIQNFIYYYKKKGYDADYIRRKFKKQTLFVMRMNNDAETFDINPCRYSMPCSDCIKILQHYGIKKVVITTDGGNVECKRSKELGEGVMSSGRRNAFGRYDVSKISK
jgi:pyrimidine deaminase RibD-like protein